MNVYFRSFRLFDFDERIFVRAQACAYPLQYLHRNCETMSGIRATFLSGTWRTCIIDMMKCLKHRFHVDSNLSCVDLVGRRLAAAHQPRATSCDCRFRGTSLYHGRVKFPWWFAGLLPGGTKKSLSAYGCIWYISTAYQIHSNPIWWTCSISSGSWLIGWRQVVLTMSSYSHHLASLTILRRISAPCWKAPRGLGEACLHAPDGYVLAN